MHIIVSGYIQRNLDILFSPLVLETWIRELVTRMDMICKGPMYFELFDNVEGDEKRGGISACQFIWTSSVTIHTYPEYNFLDLDIFSCKAIPDDVLPWVESDLGLDTTTLVTIHHRTIETSKLPKPISTVDSFTGRRVGDYLIIR